MPGWAASLINIDLGATLQLYDFRLSRVWIREGGQRPYEDHKN